MTSLRLVGTRWKAVDVIPLRMVAVQTSSHHRQDLTARLGFYSLSCFAEQSATSVDRTNTQSLTINFLFNHLSKSLGLSMQHI